MLIGEKQFVSFIEPHGLLHEGSASDKAQFHLRIKDVEKRLNGLYRASQASSSDGFEVHESVGANGSAILNSFILSWTKYPQLQ